LRRRSDHVRIHHYLVYIAGEESTESSHIPSNRHINRNQKPKETQSEQNQQNREGVKAESDESKEERQIAVKLGIQNDAAGISMRSFFSSCRTLC
jgi:hypothetical protein